MNYSAAVLPPQYSFYITVILREFLLLCKVCIHNMNTVWKPAETAASSLVRAPRTCVGISCVDGLGTLAEGGKTLGVRSFHSGDPAVIMSRLTCSTPSVPSVLYCTVAVSCSLARHRQTHLPGRLTIPPTADDNSLNPRAVPKCYWRGLWREACRDSD
jgi:hypothetical protein